VPVEVEVYELRQCELDARLGAVELRLDHVA
jgi:hypothetical protein